MISVNESTRFDKINKILSKERNNIRLSDKELEIRHSNKYKKYFGKRCIRNVE